MLNDTPKYRMCPSSLVLNSFHIWINLYLFLTDRAHSLTFFNFDLIRFPCVFTFGTGFPLRVRPQKNVNPRKWNTPCAFPCPNSLREKDTHVVLSSFSLSLYFSRRLLRALLIRAASSLSWQQITPSSPYRKSSTLPLQCAFTTSSNHSSIT